MIALLQIALVEAAVGFRAEAAPAPDDLPRRVVAYFGADRVRWTARVELESVWSRVELSAVPIGSAAELVWAAAILEAVGPRADEQVVIRPAGGYSARGTLLWPHAGEVLWRGRRVAYAVVPGGAVAPMAHEIAHLLGLPEHAVQEVPIEGCLMARGYAAEEPAVLCAACRARLGWIDPPQVLVLRNATVAAEGAWQVAIAPGRAGTVEARGDLVWVWETAGDETRLAGLLDPGESLVLADITLTFADGRLAFERASRLRRVIGRR